MAIGETMSSMKSMVFDGFGGRGCMAIYGGPSIIICRALARPCMCIVLTIMGL